VQFFGELNLAARRLSGAHGFEVAPLLPLL